MLLIIVISWIVLSFIVADVAKKKGRRYSDYFLLALLINPLICFIILIILGDSDALRLMKARQEEAMRASVRNNEIENNTKLFSRLKKYESLEKLDILLKNGVLSKEEFEEEKKKILSETYTNSKTEILKQNEENIINMNIVDGLHKLIFTEKTIGIFDKSKKEEIIKYIADYCSTKENCVKILKSYRSFSNANLIDELKEIYSPFIIKDALKVFIEFGIIEEKYPHKIIGSLTSPQPLTSSE